MNVNGFRGWGRAEISNGSNGWEEKGNRSNAKNETLKVLLVYFCSITGVW